MTRSAHQICVQSTVQTVTTQFRCDQTPTPTVPTPHTHPQPPACYPSESGDSYFESSINTKPTGEAMHKFVPDTPGRASSKTASVDTSMRMNMPSATGDRVLPMNPFCHSETDGDVERRETDSPSAYQWFHEFDPRSLGTVATGHAISMATNFAVHRGYQFQPKTSVLSHLSELSKGSLNSMKAHSSDSMQAQSSHDSEGESSPDTETQFQRYTRYHFHEADGRASSAAQSQQSKTPRRASSAKRPRPPVHAFNHYNQPLKQLQAMSVGHTNGERKVSTSRDRRSSHSSTHF